MAVSPYAKILAAVNAGAPASGGLTVPGAATIALTGENTSFWSSQRWEIYDFPPDFAAPTGWSTDANGVYFSTAVTPPSFALPALAAATGWGKYMLRLTVNGGTLAQGLVDESTALLMVSSRGQRGLGFNETSQFGGVRSQYAKELMATLRAIEAFASGGGGLPKTRTRRTAAAASNITTADDLVEVTAAVSPQTLPGAPSDGHEYEVKNNTAGNNDVLGNGHNFDTTGTATMTLGPKQGVTFTYSGGSLMWLAT
jgi:hypothetical protein